MVVEATRGEEALPTPGTPLRHSFSSHKGLDQNSNSWLLTLTFHRRTQEGVLEGSAAVVQGIFDSVPCWLQTSERRFQKRA